MTDTWHRLADDLTSLLNLDVPPLAITFSDEPPPGIPAYEGDMPEPTADGRTGRVSAGCVFWMEGVDRTFTTVAEDHANCSVGGLTHGFLTLEEAATRADVAEILECGWVTMDVVPKIPVVEKKPGAVTYGPLAETPVDPDVIFLRLDGRQLMVFSDAVPGLRVEGKPQCHIVALAKDHDTIAMSVGCALSRVRTGMPDEQMTCAVPASRLAEVVASLKANAPADAMVQRYAAEDAARFA